MLAFLWLPARPARLRRNAIFYPVKSLSSILENGVASFRDAPRLARTAERVLNPLGGFVLLRLAFPLANLSQLACTRFG
jgi:hypothetical protein